MVPPIILVCGRAGSGKSTLAENLAKALGYKCVHASDIFRQIQAHQKTDAFKTKQGKGYWESDEALKYYDERLGDFSMDKLVDDELLRAINTGNVVIDSWATAWLSKTGFKIWLEVDEDERLRRLAGRDHMDMEELRERVRIKEEKTTQIYQKLYGFTFGKNLFVFDVQINTTGLSEGEVFEKTLKILQTAKAKAKSQ